MAASHGHDRRGSRSSEKKRVESKLVDTNSRQVHLLEDGGRLLLVSHAHLESLEGYEHAHRTLQLPPTAERDVYCAEIMVQSGKLSGLICVHRGKCYVNGEETREGDKPRKMKTGTFIDLGASYQLQFISAKVKNDSPVKRVLPPTPGQSTNGKPPSKPPRQQSSQIIKANVPDGGRETSYSYCGSVDLEQSAIDEGLRSRLKRIAKEIASRASGYQDRKPPPPYEQAGNSIGYQLLHQNHSDVTTKLIDFLYPVLKELEMKDAELSESYASFVTSYDEAREAGATPQCMLPGDIPAVNFITDIVVNLCCMPHMVSLSEKYSPLFAHILAIFSSSHQNQVAMAEKRHTTKILSCMNLTIMSEAVEFQQHGWTILANTLATPTKKPLLSEASLTLALNLIEHQLNEYNLELDLSLSIIKFLSIIASTAKRCTTATGSQSEAPPIYTPTQAGAIISMLNETKVLRHVMKVPPEIRSHPSFENHYSTVVKCLAPTRGKRKAGGLKRGRSETLLDTPSPTSSLPTSLGTVTSDVPPPKPKRLFRRRRSTMGNQSRDSKKVKSVGLSEGGNLSSSLTFGNVRVEKTTANHVSASVDHVTTLANHVTTSQEKDQDREIDVSSTSEVTVETELSCTQSCSALPDKSSYEREDLVLQSISASELPQRDQVEPVRLEVHQPEQEEPVKPELHQPDQEEPARSELLERDQNKLIKAESLQHDQDKTTKSSLQADPVILESPQEEQAKPELPVVDQEGGDSSELAQEDGEKLAEESVQSESPKTEIGQHGSHEVPQGKLNELVKPEILSHKENDISLQVNGVVELAKENRTDEKNDVISSENDVITSLAADAPSPQLVADCNKKEDNSSPGNPQTSSTGRGDDVPVTSVINGGVEMSISQEMTAQGEKSESLLNEVDHFRQHDEASVLMPKENSDPSSTAKCEVSGPRPSTAEPLPLPETQSPVASEPATSGVPEPLPAAVNEGTVANLEDIHGEGQQSLAREIASALPKPDILVSEAPLKGQGSFPVDHSPSRKENVPGEVPWSPGVESLASDVKDLLSAVQAPLGEEQMVRVPSISRHSRYYRVSVKGSTPKSGRRDQEMSKGGESPSTRSQWGSATPPSIVRGHAETMAFEISGEFLSSTHQTIEEVTSGHKDMKETLLSRFEVASGVVSLWHRDKGLQASTNLVQACFSTGRDPVLFIDILQHFLKHQSPWTLAVCFVVLPVFRQLLETQTDERCVSVVCAVLHMILNRFSELILFSKGKTRASRRLSSTVDRQQREVCYNELHRIRQSLHNRLDMNSDPTTIGNCLRKVHAALKPFKEPLEDD